MFGTTEIALLVGAAVLLFGVDKLPKLARSAGQAKKEFMVGQAEADIAAERAREEARRRSETVVNADVATTATGVPQAPAVPDPLTGAPGPTTIAPPRP
ncbi:MAG TPA: twin-arginine translocase TatA/TatE family subunit [Candidatus Elarobacter sp.]|jgi:TatA/E family protein of Tat protein translocase